MINQALMSDIQVPTVFIHAKDSFTENGILQAASTDGQAREAVNSVHDMIQ